MNRISSRAMRTLVLRRGHSRSFQAWSSKSSAQLSYSTLKDKLLKLLPLNERLQQKLNLAPDSKNETRVIQNKASTSQQVTPVIVEMVGRSTTLKDMLYITDNILAKTTLADKVIILNILTQKLYNDIVDGSHIFMKPKYCSETRLRLYMEGVLSTAIKPLNCSATVRSLIGGIVEAADHMERRQVLNVFLNLQLLDWPKESRETFLMYDKVQRLQFITLNLNELLMYTDALSIYMPVIYQRQTLALMYKWFERNAFSFDNSYTFDAVERLVDTRSLRSLSNSNVLENIAIKIKNEVNISELTLQDSLVLLNIVRKLRLGAGKEEHQGADFQGLKQSLKEQVGSRLSDLSVKEVIYINKHFRTSLTHEIGSYLPEIGRKCTEILAQEQIKCDALLSLITFTPSACLDECLNSADISKLKHRIVKCMAKTDIMGLLAFHGKESAVVELGISDVLQQRLKNYAMSGLFDRDVYTDDTIISSCCSLLTNLSYCGKVDENVALVTRDKYIEYYRTKTVFDSEIQGRVLLMILQFPRMTPTSVEFLENVSHLSSFHLMKTARKLQKLKHRAFVCPSFKQKVTEAGYSRCNTALSMLQSVLVRGIIEKKDVNWIPSTVSENPKSGFRMDPVLQVLSGETIREICQKEAKLINQEQLLSLYKHSISDPSQLANILQKNPNSIKLLYWLVADDFFHGCASVDMKKLADYLNTRNQTDNDYFQRDLLRPTWDWKHLAKNRPHIFDYVKLPQTVRECVYKAFNGKVEQGVFWNDKLYVDMLVQMDGKKKAVSFVASTQEKAGKNGKLQKVAFFYRISNKIDVFPHSEFAKFRLIQELQQAGFKCVVIWDQEWHSIANRTLEERVRLIKSKVFQNSVENTATILSYNLESVKQGPFKDFFVN